MAPASRPKILSILAQISLHGVMVSALAALSALLMTDASTIGLYIEALGAGRFSANPLGVLIHVGLSACAWALLVIGALYAQQLRRGRAKRVMKLARGTAATETLIILMPFLLLTSGLAQMGLMNIAGMLSDLAAYQGARAAMIWLPEQQIRRVPINASCDMNTTNSVCNRARTAVAFTLAPSAPSNYQLTIGQPNPSNEDFRRARGVMAAAFGMGSSTGSSGYNSANRSLTFSRGERGTQENVTYSGAFDTHSFSVRAARKVSNAYQSLEEFRLINSGNNVGVAFTYKYQLVFPWFAWIFGQRDGLGGAYYLPIQREFTLPAQPNMG